MYVSIPSHPNPSHLALLARDEQTRVRTTKELIVPSSTTCVLTIAVPRRAQNVAATKPAWTAVIAVSAVEPCSRNAPVEMSWRGRVMR